MAGPGHFAVLSALVFAIGLFGVIASSDLLRSLIAAAVLFVAPLIAIVGFAQTGGGGAQPPAGNAFAVVSLLAIVGETSAALAAAALLWRRTGSVEIDEAVEGELI
jgi:NADH:ubiquinone oxidoreductase subunit K